ncbi:MAG: type fimbrial biosis protein PilP [Moraxellaceae bacterium]|jgi:type IV pilus assembly protein PilP|nr:type fimbrial biosis protein PilP [Moraxellaceae bacterium]
MIPVKALFLGLVAAASLAGCSAGFEDVESQMEAIRQKPRGRVDPPPEFTPMPTYTYAAHQLRSPFAPPVNVELLVSSLGKTVEPDLNRPQEYLERFSLEALRFKGTLQRPDGPLFAILEDGNGSSQRVKVGNYLGKNQGKIVDITPTQVSIVEIVPDGRDGWVERPRSLTLSE